MNDRRRRTLARLTPLLLAAPLLAFPQQASAASWQGRLVLAEGHVDAVHMTLSGDQLDLKLREDVTGTKVEHQAEEVVLQVTDAAQLAVPDGTAFDFLGSVGETIWLIPEVQNPQVVWAGWDAETIAPGALANDQLELELSSASGPGSVHIFNNSPVGEPVMLFNPQDGPDAINFNTGPGNHSHANWSFSAPGRYDLEFTVRGKLLDGTAVSDSEVYTFIVGELPSETPEPTPAPDPKPTPDPSPEPSPAPTPSPKPIPDPKPGTSVSQEITATIPKNSGALVLSLEPDDGTVTLPPATLSADQQWIAKGSLAAVKVSDSRESAPGWNVTGRITQIIGSDGPESRGALGWSPKILTHPTTGKVSPGAAIAATPGGDLREPATLASAPAGKGTGTSLLSAELTAAFPAEATPGNYRTTLTLTVI